MAFGDLAAGFLALGEAAFFGLFFGAALGLAGDFLATVFFFAGLFAFEAGFFAGLFFLAGDLAFEAGFAGDFLAALGDLAAGLAALGDLRSARSARTSSARRRTPPSRLAFAAGLAAFGDLAAGFAALGDLAAGLGLFFGVAFLGAGLRRRAVARIT